MIGEMKNSGEISVEAICKIVGLDDDLIIKHSEMGKQLSVTFFPYEGTVSEHTRRFYLKLKDAFICNGVTIVPFENALMRLNRKKIKKGIHLIVLGEQEVNNMPAEYLISYNSLILNIVDDEQYMAENYMQKSFERQAAYGQALLAWNFVNFVVGVGKGYWISYGATGLNDVYEMNYEVDFEQEILKTIISKMYAPISPTPLSEFKIIKRNFKGNELELKPFLDDLVKGSKLLSDTGLMNYRFSIEDIKFKKEAYKKIYKIMLDNRTGVHFGYISRQLPVKLSKVYKLSDIQRERDIHFFDDKDYTYYKKKIYIKLKVNHEEICLKVPDVETLTSISGSDKVNLEYKDIVKMGLKSGEMTLQFASDVDPIKNKVRASFDTKVILSNAVATAIYASILKYVNPEAAFPKMVETNGLALTHWHGYVDPELIPKGWEIYGGEFPVFMCSAQQAAVYGFIGKGRALMKHIRKQQEYELRGDVHVEPDHGVNVTWESVTGIAEFLLANRKAAQIGTEFFPLVKNHSTL